MRLTSTLSFLLLLVIPWDCGSAQAIQGHLLEVDTGEPIILTQVTLLSGSGHIVDQTFSDETGYFVVASEVPGDFFLRAERIGYASRVDGIFELGSDAVLTVEFRLGRAPVALDTLSVEAERRVVERDVTLELLGFYDRQRIGFGRFIGPDEIARKPATQTTDFLRMIPRVRINQKAFGQSTVSIAGRRSIYGAACFPKVLIDGVVVFGGGGEAAKLDEVVSPSEIKGIEVYRSGAETPLQFGGSSSPCGVILIWTR